MGKKITILRPFIDEKMTTNNNKTERKNNDSSF